MYNMHKKTQMAENCVGKFQEHSIAAFKTTHNKKLVS